MGLRIGLHKKCTCSFAYAKFFLQVSTVFTASSYSSFACTCLVFRFASLLRSNSSSYSSRSSVEKILRGTLLNFKQLKIVIAGVNGTRPRIITRMHSSRMRTARSSSRRRGVVSTRHPPDQTPPEQTPPRSRPPYDQAPPPCRQKHTCKHITLPQTSFAAGKYE